MTDGEFLAALERCDLPAEQFDHAAHIRAGYLYLRAAPFAEALGRIGAAIRRYATHLGKPDKYHETVTVAFLALIEQHRCERGDPGDWAAFARANPDLLAKDVLLGYYDQRELDSPMARRTFVLPRQCPPATPASA